MSMKQSVQRERKGMKKFTKPLCTNDIGIECVGSTDPTKPPKMYLLRYCTVPQTLYVLHHQGFEEPYVVSMTRKEYTELLDYFLFLCPETTNTTVRTPLTRKRRKNSNACGKSWNFRIFLQHLNGNCFPVWGLRLWCIRRIDLYTSKCWQSANCFTKHSF